MGSLIDLPDSGKAPNLRILVAVLASPPTTPGDRTRARVELARQHLGADRVAIVNIFSRPTYRTTDISSEGEDESGWVAAREPISNAIADGAIGLLAYGTSMPTGVARFHHRAQVSWLHEALISASIPVFQVGDGPRHPSRWQRWTSRAYPNMAFTEALRLCYTRYF